MKLTICLLCLLLLNALATAQNACPRGVPLEIRPGLWIYPNDNPNPLPCPIEPPADEQDELVVTWGPELLISAPHINAFVPRVTTWGDAVHVVWQWSTGLPKVQFRSSFDRGSTWHTIKTIVSGPMFGALRPAIAAWNRNLYVVCDYSQLSYPYFIGAGFTMSPNAGLSWMPLPTSLIYEGGMPVVSVWGDYVNVVGGGVVELHRFSRDGGQTFQPADTISIISSGPQLKRMLASHNCVYLTYFAESEIFFQRSTDYGQHFNSPVILSTDDSIPSQCVSLTCTDQGDVYVAWMDYKYSPYAWTGDILVRHSSDFGEHWGPERQVTFDHLAVTSGISASDSQVHVTWEDHLTNSILEAEVYYRNSSNQGQTWNQTQRLTQIRGYCTDLDMTQRGDTLHLVWCEPNPYWGAKILYKRGIATQNSSWTYLDIDDKINNNNLAVAPNPFNFSTEISFQINRPNILELTVINLEGKEVKKLYQGELMTGDHQFAWEGKNEQGLSVASGIYLVRLMADNKVKACKKIMLLK